MKIDAETSELNGQVQFIAHMLIAADSGETTIPAMLDWRKEAAGISKLVLELIDRLKLPKWESKDKDDSHLWN